MAELAEKCNINLIANEDNPDELTRDILNDCIAEDQITRGKTDVFKESRWLAQAQSIFPNGDAKVKPGL